MILIFNLTFSKDYIDSGSFVEVVVGGWRVGPAGRGKGGHTTIFIYT